MLEHTHAGWSSHRDSLHSQCLFSKGLGHGWIKQDLWSTQISFGNSVWKQVLSKIHASNFWIGCLWDYHLIFMDIPFCGPHMYFSWAALQSWSNMGHFVVQLHSKDSPWLLCLLFLLISMWHVRYYYFLNPVAYFACKSLLMVFWLFLCMCPCDHYDGSICGIVVSLKDV